MYIQPVLEEYDCKLMLLISEETEEALRCCEGFLISSFQENDKCDTLLVAKIDRCIKKNPSYMTVLV